MMQIDEMEKMISMMRVQAQQLDATANNLEAMIQPWKHMMSIMDSNMSLAREWAKLWQMSKTE